MKIIDIGADKGQYLSLFLKNFYFLINRIYAFEPNNQSYNNLKLADPNCLHNSTPHSELSAM